MEAGDDCRETRGRVANLVAEADPALELRESIEVGVKAGRTPADQGE